MHEHARMHTRDHLLNAPVRPCTMNKAKINNEIILMRRSVHQARAHIIKKLTRGALKLRQKKGTEAQKAKNSRKAERLAAEILSVKEIKRDDITKFILKNTLTLEEILQNRNFEPLTRIMARIGNHKKLKLKITEFKKKYPNYINFLGPGRKKKSILERKDKMNPNTNTHDVKSSKSDDTVDFNERNNDSSNYSNVNKIKQLESKDENETETENEDETETENEDETETENEDETEHQNKSKDESEDEEVNMKPETIQNSVINVKTKTSLPSKRKKLKDDKEKLDNLEPETLKKKPDSTKIISKQAIVKKFNDIIQDEGSNLDVDKEISNDFDESNIKIEKQIDSFFVMEDGETNYLSIVPAKSKLDDMEDDYDDYTNKVNKQNFSRQQNEDIFSTKFRNKDSKFNSNKFNSSWESQDKRKKRYKQEKVGNKTEFKKFSREYKDKSNSFGKHAKSNYEGKKNEILHPSWEAKKKQQEILKQGFQGKKIVFDDNL